MPHVNRVGIFPYIPRSLNNSIMDIRNLNHCIYVFHYHTVDDSGPESGLHSHITIGYARNLLAVYAKLVQANLMEGIWRIKGLYFIRSSHPQTAARDLYAILAPDSKLIQARGYSFGVVEAGTPDMVSQIPDPDAEQPESIAGNLFTPAVVPDPICYKLVEVPLPSMTEVRLSLPAGLIVSQQYLYAYLTMQRLPSEYEYASLCTVAKNRYSDNKDIVEAVYNLGDAVVRKSRSAYIDSPNRLGEFLQKIEIARAGLKKDLG